MSLEEYVEQYKKIFPDKYIRAQQIGESYMNCSYNLTSGIDEEGEILKFKELKKLIDDEILSMEDLDEKDIYLLNKYYKNINENINEKKS